MNRRGFLLSSAAAAATVALALTGVAGFRSAFRFDVVRERAILPSLRAPLRVAWLCDLHHGPFIRSASVRAWVDATLAQAPDLIVLGGDLVDKRPGPEGDQALVAELARLRSPLGVLAVWGNHDRTRYRRPDAFAASLTEAGITVLVNRGIQVREDLFVAGIDDYRTGRPDLDAALRAWPSGAACLLASHNPDVLPEVPVEVDLTLCGHTHGGQIVLPWFGPPLSSSQYGRRFVAGWVQGPARGYVSRGLGVGLLPVRINCPAELTLVDLLPRET